MIAVRNCGMPAIFAVLVTRFMTIAWVTLSTCFRVAGAHLDSVLINVVTVDMMQMAVMQIVRMAIVHERNVPTVGTVRVIVFLVGITLTHDFSYITP